MLLKPKARIVEQNIYCKSEITWQVEGINICKKKKQSDNKSDFYETVA